MSDKRTSRFRSAEVTPATSRRMLNGEATELGQADQARQDAQDLAARIVAMGPRPELDALRAVVAEYERSEDPNRRYQAHRTAAMVLLVGQDHDRDGIDWAARADVAIALLWDLLAQQPVEPTLLNLLAVAYYELGYTPIAKRIFRKVLELDPDNTRARSNLRNARSRPKGSLADKLPRSVRTHAEAFHADVRAKVDGLALDPVGTISLIMIVKDEEDMLGGCLTAVGEHVDEIIVVDTGSSDATVEIAESFGAKVVEHPWTGSFADARNVSIEHATCDWVLYLDADEHMVEGDAERLAELTRRPWIEGWHLIEFNFTGGEGAGTQVNHNALRMFRNRPQYRWRGRIHEQKLWSFPTFLPERFAMSGVRINHYGYLKGRIADKDKHQRNLQLLLAEAAEDGGDAFTEFNIGTELASMGQWPAARAHLERSYELLLEVPDWAGIEFASLLVGRLVTTRRILGDYEGARRLAGDMLATWPDYTDLVFERGVCWNAEGDHAAAVQELTRAIAMGDAPARYPSVQGTGSHLALVVRARARRALGEVEAAIADLDQALRTAPAEGPVIVDLVEGMLEAGTPGADIVAFVDERCERPAISSLLTMATLLHEHGDLDTAESVYRRILARREDVSAARVGLAELEMVRLRGREAMEALAPIGLLDPFADRAGRSGILAALLAGGDQEDLDRMFGLVSGAAGVGDDELAFYGAWRALLAGGSPTLSPGEGIAAHVLENLNALAKLELVEEFERLVGLLELALPDPAERQLSLAELYLARSFADMAAEDLIMHVQQYGPSARALAGLAKAATMKDMYEDGAVFARESLGLDPDQPELVRLLAMLDERLLQAG